MATTAGATGLEKNIIEKAWKDENFKKQLMENPKAVLQNELKINIPEGLEIRIVEETENAIYLVLPANPAKASKAEEREVLVEPMAYN